MSGLSTVRRFLHVLLVSTLAITSGAVHASAQDEAGRRVKSDVPVFGPDDDTGDELGDDELSEDDRDDGFSPRTAAAATTGHEGTPLDSSPNRGTGGATGSPAPSGGTAADGVEPLSAASRLAHKRSYLRIGGYIQPQFDLRYRPSAFPRDRTNYGASATRTGIIITGEPLEKWSYTFHLVISAALLNKISAVEAIDRDGDGSPDALDVTQEADAGLFIERAVVDYNPIAPLRIRLGQMRIPFTIQNQSPNFSLLFPDRSGPNQFFLSGTDLGGLVTYAHPLFQLSGGVYNGTGANNLTASVRGVLYALRFDVNPLGEFPFSEIQNRSGPLRIGVGAGLLYFPSEVYDNSGFEGINVRDLRASLSLRMKVAGFYAQAELLRRQQTDNLSSRPVVATGSYAQGSYYIPISDNRYGLAPIARAGVTIEDQSFSPRTAVLTEAGGAFYWHRGDDPTDTVKLIVQYFGEQRLTEDEDAYGATTQLQLQF